MQELDSNEGTPPLPGDMQSPKFYFISNNTEISQILIDNGYNEYQWTKNDVNTSIRSGNTMFCRDEPGIDENKKNIDTDYLLHYLLDEKTTNILLIKGDKIIGLMNFKITQNNGMTIIEDAGLCVSSDGPRGSGTLMLTHLKGIARVLGVKQIKIFAPKPKPGDNITPNIQDFYIKNGFNPVPNSGYLIFDINESENAGGSRPTRHIKRKTRKYKKKSKPRKTRRSRSRKARV